MAMTPEQRISARTERADDHDIWTGKVDRNGIPVTKHNSKSTTVRRLVWELANGPLPPSARMVECPENRLCVRLEHLGVAPGQASTRKLPRARRGMGSMREVRPNKWELRLTIGKWDDGRPRSVFRLVTARNPSEATDRLVAFVEEMKTVPLPDDREVRDLTVNQAMERFLAEYLSAEKGRADKTIHDYRLLHDKWFSPTIGGRPLKRVDPATMDELFGAMRLAGLSSSRLNQAKSLYTPFFRWAKRRGMTPRNPMIDFEMPTSTYRSKERTPPEVEELSLLLATSVEVVPDIAPLLVLGAVTGMRRGELVAVLRSGVGWGKNQITVDAAVGENGKIKSTKTRTARTFSIDPETVAMLQRHCDQMDERAAAAGVDICKNPFLFSLALDCSLPMPPDFFTKRVGVLKGHLGIEEKSPEVVELEDEALGLRRQAPGIRPAGRPGPAPTGGMSLKDIGQHLGRSERWAALAIEAAERREAARANGLTSPDFDGSILALRKFTSSELLDAGFNISMVAQRQGHGPQVLARHYAKSRKSADKKAAEHLGQLVHAARRQPPRT